VKQERLHNSPDIILTYFDSLQGPHKAVGECTAGWYWLNDLLEPHGVELILAHAEYLRRFSKTPPSVAGTLSFVKGLAGACFNRICAIHPQHILDPMNDESLA
jgi:hypothetical protein